MSSRYLIAALATTVTGAHADVPMPHAARKPFVVESPNGNREDPYYWLRDDTRSNPEMLQYLNNENTYYEQYRQRFTALEKNLAKEMIARMKPDDDSVPYKDGDWWYYSRVEAGKDYAIHARKREINGKEEIMLDGNEESRRANFFNVCATEVSFDGNTMVYGVDVQGRYQCTLRVRDLRTGKDNAEVIVGTSGSVAWAADNKTFFYIENDPTTLLTTRVKKHVIGSDPRTDKIVYEEKDASFYLGLFNTSDKNYVMLVANSTVSTEYHALQAAQPDAAWQTVIKRERDFLADIDHVKHGWIIRHNFKAPNYRVSQASDVEIGDRNKWRDIVSHSDKSFISSIAAFDDYFVYSERSEGLQRIRYRAWADKKTKLVAADDPAFTMRLDINAERNVEWLRYNYTSLTTPSSVFEINMRSGERRLLKQQAVLGNFDKNNYVSERIWISARDGTKVPVSMVYRKGVKKDGSAPLLQYAYGSYGSSTDPGFNADRVSLLDRGVIYAIAHIRGGQEMGRHWYDQGKMLNKKNTFNDFIDVTEALIKQRYTSKDKVLAMGGSAGGLLMGAIVNLRPDLYRGVVAAVPFVDVVTTMLDESIPLTTNEFDEWGNPKNKPYYDYMLSYSPYDNVKAQRYPALLVTTGLHDSQVQYFEPAKWVAKLRDTKIGDEPLLMRVNMEAGHGGKSGRYQGKYERAQDFAFMLDLVGIKQ